MTAEFEIFRKDLIKLNIYKEVVSDNTVSLKFFLDGNGNGNDYFKDIHEDDVVVNRYGCFNISEDKNGGFITIRPALVNMGLKIVLVYKQPFTENKTLTIFRNGITEPERNIDINRCSSIEFVVDGNKYIMKINSDDNGSVTENISYGQSVINQSATENNNVKNTADNIQTQNTQNEISSGKLDAIKAESEKDYAQYAEKLDALKEDYNFDKSLLEYYKDNDLVPIEKIFSELDEKIKEAENQITLFINARRDKTKEIEE